MKQSSQNIRDFWISTIFIPGVDSCVPDSSGCDGEEADLPAGGGGHGEDRHDWQDGEDWYKEGEGGALW